MTQKRAIPKEPLKSLQSQSIVVGIYGAVLSISIHSIKLVSIGTYYYGSIVFDVLRFVNVGFVDETFRSHEIIMKI